MRILMIAALAALVASVAVAVAAEPDLPNPPPSDWMKQAELFGRVATLDNDEPVIAWTRTNQTDLSSGFLFDLSRRLLAKDADEALEWYVVALIRGQYDAARCRDDTAKRAVSRLSNAAEVVRRYGHTHPHQFGEAGLRALARADLFTHTVSPDWICAQGLTGMGGRSLGVKPAESWPAVEQRLRGEYAKQFEAMAKR